MVDGRCARQLELLSSNACGQEGNAGATFMLLAVLIATDSLLCMFGVLHRGFSVT